MMAMKIMDEADKPMAPRLKSQDGNLNSIRSIESY